MKLDRVKRYPSSAGQIDDKTSGVPNPVNEYLPALLWVQQSDLNQILDSETYLVPSQILRENGWNVTLTQSAPAGSTMTEKSGLLSIPLRKIYLLGQGLLHLEILRWLFSRDDIDIVMFHEVSSIWFLPVPLIYRLAGRQRPLFVMDVRTLHMGAGTRGIKDHLRAFYYRYSRAIADFWVDGHLVITPQMAEAVGIKPDRLLGVWPSGVDPKKFEAALEDRRWPSDEEPVRLVYIGSIHIERNIMALCHAVIAATKQGMNFTLTIVGSGDQKAEIEALAATTDGAVIVKPPVPHKEVWKVLADAHIGVLPFPDELKFRVSSFIKLFEYMAAGMPVLATRIIAHTDVVGDGEYAFWADGSDVEAFVDALRHIWAARDSLPELGKQAVAAVDQWTWEASATKLADALKSLMSEEQH